MIEKIYDFAMYHSTLTEITTIEREKMKISTDSYLPADL